jgi:hypothetical protein
MGLLNVVLRGNFSVTFTDFVAEPFAASLAPKQEANIAISSDFVMFIYVTLRLGDSFHLLTRRDLLEVCVRARPPGLRRCTGTNCSSFRILFFRIFVFYASRKS